MKKMKMAVSNKQIYGDDTPSHPETGRIYPPIIPPLEGHPTFEQFEIVNTGDERGRGLRSRIAFRKGDPVARLSGVLTNQTTLETIQISPTLHLYDPWFCRYLLHSCDPNLTIDTAAMESRAVKEINPTDYLSIDYTLTEDFLSRQFACHCGAPNCRRWLVGRRELPNEEGERVLSAIERGKDPA